MVKGSRGCGRLLHHILSCMRIRDLPGMHQMDYPKSWNHETRIGALYLQRVYIESCKFSRCQNSNKEHRA